MSRAKTEARFEYDVALSFAGEQRLLVNAVAKCLKDVGVRVFYDHYEKANLWGKNLYQHLSEVYRRKAQYCIVFASKEYAEKVWTNHELRSAQARALEEKGAEYILPVRFDSTEIPGLLPTVGYLEFDKEGTAGICEAMLQKLGMQPMSAESKQVSCDFSTLAMVRVYELQKELYAPLVDINWEKKIELVVAADSTVVNAVFSQFRGLTKPVVVAHGFDVAIAKIGSVSRTMTNGRAVWHVAFDVQRTEFTNDTEMGIGETSADDLAEQRARRLLLDEYPMSEALKNSQGNVLSLLEDAIKEVMFQGIRSGAKISGSIFPTAWKAYGSSPENFIEIAWITAIADLKLSATAERIEYLKLLLNGNVLNVDFLGYRHRKYVNVDPHRIEVHGELPLEGALISSTATQQ